MGGIGSGRWYRWDANETTGDYRQIDLREMDHENVLQPGRWSTMRWFKGDEEKASIRMFCESRTSLRLIYRHRRSGEDWQSQNYSVAIEWTDCHFGGERPWFRCPGKGCGRRCLVLYLARYAVCRECRDLTYRRCNISGDELAIARHKLRKVANTLDVLPEERMGPIEDQPVPDRPKHMHTETYRELRTKWTSLQRKAQQLKYESLMEWGRKLGVWNSSG